MLKEEFINKWMPFTHMAHQRAAKVSTDELRKLYHKVAKPESKLYAWHEIGYLPIEVACMRGDIDTVTKLIEKYPNYLRSRSSRKDETLLHLAGTVEVASFLITHGADINAKDYFGNTPLHTAKDVEIARFLVDNGADVNTKNSFGKIPADTAEPNAAQFLRALKAKK